MVTRAVATVCKIVSTRSGGDRHAHDTLSNAMVSAVGEAFNNIVEHAYADRAGVARLEIDYDEDGMRVALRDDGKPFDIDAVPDPDLDALPESGMGLFIMRAFVDTVDYRPGPPNVLTLTKRL